MSWPGRVRSGTAAASPKANTPGAPGTARSVPTRSRPRSVGSPRVSISGLGVTPVHQTRVWVGIVSPSDSRTPSAVASSTVVPSRTSTPRRRSTSDGVVAQPAAQLRQHPWGQVDQHPAHLLGPQPRVVGGRPRGDQLHLGGGLGAGVPGPHDHEGAAGPPAVRVVGGVGVLQLPEHVVAQVGRLGQGLEAEAVLGHPGDVEGPADPAGGEDQPVPGQLGGRPVGAQQGRRPPLDVDGDHVPEQHLGPAQGGVQPDGDVAWLDHAGGHVGQQRAVEEVVGGAGQQQLGGVGGQVLLQAAHAVEPGEAAADDQHRRPGRRCCAFMGCHG